jgi:hypothetical protein
VVSQRARGAVGAAFDRDVDHVERALPASVGIGVRVGANGEVADVDAERPAAAAQILDVEDVEERLADAKGERGRRRLSRA